MTSLPLMGLESCENTYEQATHFYPPFPPGLDRSQPADRLPYSPGYADTGDFIFPGQVVGYARLFWLGYATRIGSPGMDMEPGGWSPHGLAGYRRIEAPAFEAFGCHSLSTFPGGFCLVGDVFPSSGFSNGRSVGKDSGSRHAGGAAAYHRLGLWDLIRFASDRESTG